MRSSPLHPASRCLSALTIVIVAIALTGCGMLGRGLRGAPIDASRPASFVAAPSPPPSPPSAGPATAETAPPAHDPSDLIAGDASSISCSMTLRPMEFLETSAIPGPPALTCALPEASESDLAISVAGDGDDASVVLTALQKKDAEDDEYEIDEYDPWESFNEAMFEFNLKLDRWAVKPVAKVYDRIMPDEVQRMIANAVDNLGSIKRMVNSLLQGKWDGAVREWSRFLLNTTMGVGGLFDIAKHEGIERSREDFGQTLGVYGVGTGPYLVLPFLEPMTVRDGIGRAVDNFLDPLGYLGLSLVERLALKVTETVNDRSLNLELFQGFEESVIDFYSAVRHAYLERRRNLIKE